MAKITAGQFKGVALLVPKDIRATEAKVRQALFNILGAYIEGARVLDGFAGSGALGLEALSRGAAFVAFVEPEGEAVVAIRDNLARVERELERSAWRVIQADIWRGLKALAGAEPPFDLVLMDPPYRRDEGKKALKAIVEYGILAPTGIVVVEHEQRANLPSVIGPLQQTRKHRYGDTVLSFYQPREAQ